MLPPHGKPQSTSVDFSHRTLGRGLDCVIHGSKIDNGGNYLSLTKRIFMAIITFGVYNALANREIKQKNALLKNEFEAMAKVINSTKKNNQSGYECEVVIGGKKLTLQEHGANIRIFEKNLPDKYTTLHCTFELLKTAMLNASIRCEFEDGNNLLDLRYVDLKGIDLNKIDLQGMRVCNAELNKICEHGGDLSGAELIDLTAVEGLSFEKVTIDCAQLRQLKAAGINVKGVTLSSDSLRENIENGDTISNLDLTELPVPKDVDLSALKLNKVKLNTKWIKAILISAAEKQNPNLFLKKVDELREVILDNVRIIESLEIDMIRDNDDPTQWKLELFLKPEVRDPGSIIGHRSNLFYETSPQQFGNNKVRYEEFAVKLMAVDFRQDFLFKILECQSEAAIKQSSIDLSIDCMTDKTATITKDNLKGILDDSNYSGENFIGVTYEDDAIFTAKFNSGEINFSNRESTNGEYRGAQLQRDLKAKSYANLQEMLDKQDPLSLTAPAVIYMTKVALNLQQERFDYGDNFVNAPETFYTLLKQEKITEHFTLFDFFNSRLARK